MYFEKLVIFQNGYGDVTVDAGTKNKMLDKIGYQNSEFLCVYSLSKFSLNSK